MRRFGQKVVVITGAANGIGLATAKLMIAEGATVVLVDLVATQYGIATESDQSESGFGISVTADVLDEREVVSTVGEIVDRFGRIDVLVNAVGGSTIIANSNIHLSEMSLSDWEKTIAFNLRGTFLCIREVVPHMKQRRYGRIVNVSSVVARGDAVVSNVAYVAAKAGIRALTRKLAIELGPFGITCNATAPGVTLTDRMMKLISARSKDEFDRKVASVPLGRLSGTEDQANVIAFLASDAAAFVSGQTIEVTGGQ